MMATYFVRPTNGSDANAGTSFGAAFQTTAKAITVVSAGDDVRLCNEATETITARLNLSTAGSATAPIKWIGSDSVDGSPLNGSSEYLITSSSGNDGWYVDQRYNDFFDIRLQETASGAGDDGWLLNSAGDYCNFFRCAANGFDSGFAFSAPHRSSLQDCEAYDNAIGFEFNSGNQDNVVTGCRSHDNSSHGFYVNNSGYEHFIKCGAWDNGGRGFYQGTSNPTVFPVYFTDCLAFGNLSSHGFEFQDLGAIVGCSSVGNGAFGYKLSGSGKAWEDVIFHHNHHYGNTSGDTDAAGTWADQGQGNNITGDPLFESETDGSEDFTPGSGSPLLNVGVPSTWGMTTSGIIGPLPAAAGGGGGGGGGGTSMIGPGGGMIGTA